MPLRKKNSLRPVPAYMTYFQASIRKIVETTGSLIERLLPKSIHAVTAKGFETQGRSLCSGLFHQLPLVGRNLGYLFQNILPTWVIIDKRIQPHPNSNAIYLVIKVGDTV